VRCGRACGTNGAPMCTEGRVCRVVERVEFVPESTRRHERWFALATDFSVSTIIDGRDSVPGPYAKYGAFNGAPFVWQK
jgi:hypothetical protein